MRTLSVSTEWLKLMEPEFTTFKLPRKNKDWDVGEIVKVVYKLQSKERKSYLRKQVLRDNNPECMDCEHANKCVMEFWKKNREGDDCFGGKRYVDWLLSYVNKHNITIDKSVTY